MPEEEIEEDPMIVDEEEIYDTGINFDETDGIFMPRVELTRENGYTGKLPTYLPPNELS